MKQIVAMICATLVVLVALVLDGETAATMAAAFVGGGGFLAGYGTGKVVADETKEV